MSAEKKPRMDSLETADVGESVSDPAQNKLTASFCELDVADKGRARQGGSEQPSDPGRSDIPQESLIPKSEISVSESSPCPASTSSCRRRWPQVLDGVSLVGGDVLTDRVLQQVLPSAGFPPLKTFVLSKFVKITDISVDLVTRLFPDLQYLDLSYCCLLTDTALLYIADRLRQLQHLDLSGVRLISARGIGYLAGHVDRHDTDALNLLQQLKGSVGRADDDMSSTDDHHDLTCLPIDNLILLGCNLLTNEALRHLSSIKELRNLDLSSNDNINAVGIGHLATLPKLTRLDLKSCLQVDNGVMAHLARMSELLELNLGECPRISFDGLITLVQRKPRITYLDISGCTGLKNDSLDHVVRGLQELRSLWLDYYHTTDAALDSVGQELPLLTDLLVRGQDKIWRKHPFSGQQKRGFSELT